MVDTRLILIEGLPGSGKTTSTEHLGTYLQEQGIACRWYLERDDHHPIPCHDLKIKELAQKLPPLWASFVEQSLPEQKVTIIESRLWQNTMLFMYMSECPIDEIVAVHQSVWQELIPLCPVLIFLYQDDVENALNRLYTLRSRDLVDKDIQTTSQYQWFQSRGLKSLDGWVQFFTEWQQVAERLYRDWPFAKAKIKDPHADWEQAYQQMYRFLRLESRR